MSSKGLFIFEGIGWEITFKNESCSQKYTFTDFSLEYKIYHFNRSFKFKNKLRTFLVIRIPLRTFLETYNRRKRKGIIVAQAMTDANVEKITTL